MSEVLYRSRVEVVRHQGAYRTARLPEGEVEFGVHSEIAEHYQLDPAEIEARDTTLDHVVAAAGG